MMESNMTISRKEALEKTVRWMELIKKASELCDERDKEIQAALHSLFLMLRAMDIMVNDIELLTGAILDEERKGIINGTIAVHMENVKTYLSYTFDYLLYYVSNTYGWDIPLDVEALNEAMSEIEEAFKVVINSLIKVMRNQLEKERVSDSYGYIDLAY